MVSVGIDLHKSQFTVCVSRGGREKFTEYPTTGKGYEAFLKRAAAWQKSGHEVKVGVESTGNTRYFKGRMEAAGIGVVVINTLKFKVVNESVKKTDKHDAATIAEFLEKDMLPESKLCSRESEQMRRLLKARRTLVRAEVVMKNQIHALLTAEGMEDVKASLQSKRGRQRVLDTLKEREDGLIAQPLIETIERLEGNVKGIEEQVRSLAAGDRMVELLMTIPGCGEICAWTIRAYTDDIKRYGSAKKYSAYAGLAPWVRNSNECVHHGKITKRGPEELRTALVQVVMGWRRLKRKTVSWRLMERYEGMKKSKGSGRTIIATARKVAVIIWHMLSEDAEFAEDKMVGGKLGKEAASMSVPEKLAKEALAEGHEKPGATGCRKKEERKIGVASKKREKAG
jgi:transposase